MAMVVVDPLSHKESPPETVAVGKGKTVRLTDPDTELNPSLTVRR